MAVKGHVDQITHWQVTGWAAESDHPEATVEVLIIVDGEVRATITGTAKRDGLLRVFPNSTGCYEFRYDFEPPLSPSRSHAVEVVAKNHGLLPNGRHTLAASGNATLELQPVFVTSTGRAGTTLLMSDLSQQSSVVLANVYPYEVKLGAYYAATLKVLTYARSRTDDDSITFAATAFNQLRAVANPWHQPHHHRLVAGEQLARLFSDSVPTRLRSTFRSIVLDYYGIVAVNQNKLEARYFAEKLNLNQELRAAVRELFGSIREIVLVRDPRDYLCSSKSFWNKGIQSGIQTLRSELPIIQRIHEQTSDDVLFVRYEDLVLDPLSSRRSIYRFIGLRDEDVVESQPNANDLKKHATTSSPASSIGRWRNELAPEEVAACHKEFESFLEAFGYVK
jgi:hypothetical protein